MGRRGGAIRFRASSDSKASRCRSREAYLFPLFVRFGERSFADSMRGGAGRASVLGRVLPRKQSVSPVTGTDL